MKFYVIEFRILTQLPYFLRKPRMAMDLSCDNNLYLFISI